MADNPLGLDPKHFTYLKSDDKSTTLKHKNGHLLTVAHSVLSPKMQTVLKSMAPKKEEKAKGGIVKEVHSEEKEPGYTEPTPHNLPRMATGGLTPGGQAYEYGLPCLNPNCKSHGRPHPNCRCYGFATGGKVGSVCKEKREHHPDCPYYADGGTADQNQTAQKKQDTPEDIENADKAWDQVHGLAPVQPQQPTLDPRTWWAKGGPVEEKSVGTVAGKPYAQGGETEHYNTPKQQKVKHYSAPKEPVSKDDSAPMEVPEVLRANPTNDNQPVNPANQAISDTMNQINQPQSPNTAQNQPQTPDTSQDQPQTPDVDQNQEFSDNPANQPTISAPLPMSPADYHMHIKNTLMDEAEAFQNDATSGKIEPKTLHDLWADKDTPGKIGTIFGLLLSGAGSGLAHQPNALLDLMQKQIDRDLQAQQNSVTNRQNYAKIAEQHAMDQAHQLDMAAGRQLTKAQAGQVQQTANQLYIANQRVLSRRAAYSDLVNNVNKMPEGPQKQTARNALALMYQQMIGDDASIYDRFAAAKTMSTYGQPGQPTSQQNTEGAFQQQNRALDLGSPTGHSPIADYNRSVHIPGIVGNASRPLTQGDIDKVQAYNLLDSKVKDVLNYAIQNRGSVNPNVLKTARQKAEELTSFYNKSVDTLGMTQGRLGWLKEQIKKNPTSLIQQVLGNNATLREIRDSNLNRRDLFLSGPGGLGFPKQPRQAEQASQQQMYSKSGKPIIQVNGKWIYK